MSNSNEEMKRLDEEFQAELETWRTTSKEEAERCEREQMKNYEAQVQAQLIDPDKLKKYVEAMNGEVENLRNEPPPSDKQTQETAMRKAQEIMLSDQSFAWLSPSTPCPPNMVIDGASASHIWKSADPMFNGGASAQDFFYKWQNKFEFKLSTFGGIFTKPLVAQAWSGGYLRFKIPGKHIPWGRIEVTPYFNIQGSGRVAGGLRAPWYPGCGAWASIVIQTRMAQSVAGYPYPWIKDISPWTTPYTFWQAHSPPTGGFWGWHDIRYTGYVPQAKVVAEVTAWQDIYIDIRVILSCDQIGGDVCTDLVFISREGQSEFIAVPFVCMKILADYSNIALIKPLVVAKTF